MGVLDGFWKVTGAGQRFAAPSLTTLANTLPHMIEPSITKDILTKDNLRVNSEELIGGLELFQSEFAFEATDFHTLLRQLGSSSKLL